jgi:phosphatidylglycerophosphate synthase
MGLAQKNLIATVLFVVFALTDWADGYLARKLNQTSAFGAFLDPVADKFLVCASLLVLVHLDRADVFVALIIIGREIAISSLREWMAIIGATKSVAVHMLGKLKTTVQMVAIPFLLFDGVCWRDRHPCLGHLADLAGCGADGLVHGLLPAEGPARNPRPGPLMPPSPMTCSQDNAWLRAMPWVFVLIWSTGFIVARYGMPHAPPMKFLAVRYALSILCFLPWIWLAAVKWPVSRSQWLHLSVTGILMHAGYLGGVWAAVKAGMGSGLSALIVGCSRCSPPSGSAAWAGRAGDVSRRQWLGLLLGFAGLVLVVSHKFSGGGPGDTANWLNLSLAVLALLAITVGTLYQKRFVQTLRRAQRQRGAADGGAGRDLPLALLEPRPCAGTRSWPGHGLVGAGLTLGGSSLLYMLIQRGAAASVTSLMYLVPPCTALIAWAAVQ